MTEAEKQKRWRQHGGVAIHEAGHAIVMMELLGEFPHELSIDAEGNGLALPGRTVNFLVFAPFSSRKLKRLRDDLAIDVAGCVAEQILVWRALLGFLPDRKGRRRLGPTAARLAAEMGNVHPEHLLLSFSLRQGADPKEGPGDLRAALHHIRQIGEGLGRPVDNRFITAEVERAERRTERILNCRWNDVVKLARSLCRRESGRMTARQIGRLLGEKFDGAILDDAGKEICRVTGTISIKPQPDGTLVWKGECRPLTGRIPIGKYTLEVDTEDYRRGTIETREIVPTPDPMLLIPFAGTENPPD